MREDISLEKNKMINFDKVVEKREFSRFKNRDRPEVDKN